MSAIATVRRAALAALVACAALGLEASAQEGRQEAPPDAEAAAATLTNQMIGALRSYERAAPQARARLEESLRALASRREAALYALAGRNPRGVLLRQIPPGLRDRLPASVAAVVEQEVDATGTLLGRISDDFDTGRSRQDFFLEVPVNGATRRLSVNASGAGLSADEMMKLVGGRLTMRGLLLRDSLVVGDRARVQVLAAGGAPTAASSGTTTTLAAPVVETTLVLMGSFTDKALTCTGADIANRLFSTDPALGSMNRLYQETSRQAVAFSGDVRGPFAIPYSSTGACDYTGWGNALKAAAQNAGINLANYRRISYAIPSNANCGWSGLAYLGGSFPTQSWVASCGSTGVFAHEIGHNLRFHHAATPSAEYGDGSDPMGGARMVQFNASNRVAAGWLPSGNVVDATAAGSYGLTSLSLTSAFAPQVLRLRKADTSEYYFVSLRTGSGFDAALSTSYLNKVSVHRSPGTLGAKTYLLAQLSAGQSFTDAANGITISPISVSGGGATISVTTSTPQCATAEPSIATSPVSQQGAPGATKQYTVSVTNRNSASCAASAFAMSQTLPPGFGGSFSPSSVTLAPGASASLVWSVASPASSADGSYTIRATVTDSAAGGQSASADAAWVVYADATPPAVAVLGPANGAVLKRGTITVSASASDASGIARVEFYVGATRIATDSSEPYSVKWNARRYARGDYTITARAFDTAGNSADASVTITLR